MARINPVSTLSTAMISERRLTSPYIAANGVANKNPREEFSVREM